MKYYLVTWTAEDADGESFSGNASMEWDGDLPEEDIINSLKLGNPKLNDYEITLQDKLQFDSLEELNKYGSK